MGFVRKQAVVSVIPAFRFRSYDNLGLILGFLLDLCNNLIDGYGHFDSGPCT